MSYRKKKSQPFKNIELFSSKNWGLIIYDEVHLLPAPVFRVTANLQAKRRLGLTATLIREDGLESDVFSLIGPKRFDIPWKVLEKQSFIATASCHEIRIKFDDEDRLNYIAASKKEQFRLASTNKKKLEVLKQLLHKHKEDHILIIGHYIAQLKEIAKEFKLPLITGSVKTSERDKLYNEFRKGDIKKLIVSKVANFAVDLPDANIAIQVSGTFGSRQEEAQRLGRILRPKEKDSYFYTLVSKDSCEAHYAHNRQRFLAEQGYKYFIEHFSTKNEKSSEEGFPTGNASEEEYE